MNELISVKIFHLAGHSYYDIILGMNKRELQKGA